MRTFYYITALLALAGLPVSLWVGATMVATYSQLPFIAFTVPVWLDLAIACWVVGKLE